MRWRSSAGKASRRVPPGFDRGGSEPFGRERESNGGWCRHQPPLCQARSPSPGSETLCAWARVPRRAEAPAVPNRFVIEASFAASPASQFPCPVGLPPKGPGSARRFPKSRHASALANAGAASSAALPMFPRLRFLSVASTLPHRPVAGKFRSVSGSAFPRPRRESVTKPESHQGDSACG